MAVKICFLRKIRKTLIRRRVSALFLGAVTFMVASGVNALGLGDITLKSNLNQQLLAEIELLEVRDLAESEILVGLASPADFERQGVERTYLLTDLQFAVQVARNGEAKVVVTSTRPIREPFLDFIIEARWPSGKLLREYTLLLDLPVFSDVTAAPVSPVQTETIQSSGSSASGSSSSNYNPRSPYAESQPQQASDTYSSVTPSYAEGDYRVQKNDTLWEIALGVRPGGQVSVHQMMMALHRANPEAFISGNINLLKSGQILRVPDSDEIISLNQQQAVQDVARHNAEWGGSGPVTTNAAPLEASTSELSSYEETSDVEGRLSLSSPDDSYDVEKGRLSGGSDVSSEMQSQVEALEAELAATSETLDKAQSENAELLAKLKSMEEHVSTMESAIELNNETATALQLAEAERQQAANEALAAADLEPEIEDSVPDPLSMGASSEIIEEELALAEAESEAESELELSEETEADVEDMTEAQVEPKASIEPKPIQVIEEPKPIKTPAPKAQASGGILDLLMNNILYIGLALIALLGAVVFFIKQRNGNDEEFDDFLNNTGEFASEEELTAFDEEVDDDIDDVALDNLVEDTYEPESIETFEEEIEQVEEEESPEAQTEDVVAESDIYIAYGKYEQAEDMLRSALNADPSHHEARLKLLEIYAAQGNVESFDPHYAELRVSDASDSLIARAASLRDSIGGAAPFEPSLFAAVDQDDDLDLDGDFGSIDSESIEHISDSEDDSFDLDLNEAFEEDVPELDLPDDTVLTLDSTDASLTSSSDTGLELDVSDLELDTQNTEGLGDSDDLGFDLEGLDFDGDDEADTLSVDELEAMTSAPEDDLKSEDFDLDAELGLGDTDGELDIDFELGELEEALAKDESEEIPVLDELESIEPVAEASNDFSEIDLMLDSEAGGDLDADLDLLEPADTESLDEDDVSLTGTSFDLSDLDDELEALTSNLDSDDKYDSVLDLDDALPKASEDLDDLSMDIAEEPEEGPLDESDFDFGDLAELSEELTTKKAEPDALSLDEPDTDFDFDFDDEITEVSPESKEENLGFELPEIDPDSADDEDLDFLSDSDETATKLDLAAAYIDMGDMAGAKEIIEEIMKEGTETQKSEAKSLLAKIGS